MKTAIKLTMKILLFLIIGLSLSNPAVSKEKFEVKKQIINFQDPDFINGHIKRPKLLSINARNEMTFSRFLDLYETFLKKIIDSTKQF